MILEVTELKHGAEHVTPVLPLDVTCNDDNAGIAHKALGIVPKMYGVRNIDITMLHITYH